MGEVSSEEVTQALDQVLSNIKENILNHPVDYRKMTFVRALDEWASRMFAPVEYQELYG